MKPEDLKALLEKASPRPWEKQKWARKIEDADGRELLRDIDSEERDLPAIAAVMTLAPLLIELWEAVEADWSPQQKEILAKLEES